MSVSILQASIKLLNAPFHLVFLLLTVTFSAPHGSLLSHFYLPPPVPFQADWPHPPSLAAPTPALPEHLGTKEQPSPTLTGSHCHLISPLIGYWVLI